ncbi:MAG: VacJ family lipoprotein [Alphaproteobacteria bacterium]|nr:VacJ family lipoprotein [Alphaproteobacteria bacterium]
MIENKRIKNWLCCFLLIGLTACESPIISKEATPSDDFGSEELADPLDGFSRAMMELNFFLDDYLLQPAATAYKALTPEFVQTGVGNFTQYVKLPFYMLNDILQWKIDHFAQNFWVMTINTFSGVGLINGSGYFEVYAKPNDFGITLHKWGAGPGVEITLPFWGPTCFRDVVGSIVGLVTDPVSIVARYYDYGWANYSVTGLGYVHSRSSYLGQLESLRKESYDPYITIKSIVDQKRASELKENE